MRNAPIIASARGDNIIIAAQDGIAIRVIAYVLSWTGNTGAQWMSDVGGTATALSGVLAGGLDTDIVVPDLGGQARGWFQTDSGMALNLNLSGTTINGVGGHLVYELIGA